MDIDLERPKRARLEFTLPDDQKLRIEMFASANGVSVAHLIREVMSAYLDERETARIAELRSRLAVPIDRIPGPGA